MIEYTDRFYNDATGKWEEGRRAGSNFILNEEADRRIAEVATGMRIEIRASEARTRFWVVCGAVTCIISILGVAFTLIVPLAEKIYGQAAIDTAQNEKIVANKAAIVDLRQETESQMRKLQEQLDRRFNNNERRFDQQDRILDKILERTAAFYDPQDRRGIILPKQEVMK